MTDTTSEHFERSRAQLKAERDSMVQKIKDDVNASKRKALSKV